MPIDQTQRSFQWAPRPTIGPMVRYISLGILGILAAACTTSGPYPVQDLPSRITPTVMRQLGLGQHAKAPRITCSTRLLTQKRATVRCTVQDGNLLYPATVTYRDRPGDAALIVRLDPNPIPADQILD